METLFTFHFDQSRSTSLVHLQTGPGTAVMSRSRRTRTPLRTLLQLMATLSVAATTACDGSDSIPAPSCVVPIGTSPQRGPADAWVTIVEFSDFQCVFCGRAEGTIAEVDRERPELRWVYKHFPLVSIHANAFDASITAECAHEQGKFWEMHALLFKNQSKLDRESLRGYAQTLGLDLTSYDACFAGDAARGRVVSDVELGLDAGVQGTPAFFINGRLLEGAYPASDFTRVIDEARRSATQSHIPQAEYYADTESARCGGG
ncbi:MAG TPA: DsbA family protein [Polyangiaceae bacterium]|nr:DsbA family protein [Polyangiaceae bacterium]